MKHQSASKRLCSYGCETVAHERSWLDAVQGFRFRLETRVLVEMSGGEASRRSESPSLFAAALFSRDCVKEPVLPAAALSDPRAAGDSWSTTLGLSLNTSKSNA